VIKVEPTGGEATRSYGPFYKDIADPNRSLYFWHYNFGKRGIVLDLDSDAGRASLASLARSADVIIDTRARDYLPSRGLGYEALSAQNPGLIYARISPFGDSGPWADYRGSDLIHLALGGVMMNCGYSADPFGNYETPPIAPQMWHSYQIVGEMAAFAIMAALNYRHVTGVGQFLSTAVHEAVSKNTETDLPNWIYLRSRHFRQTAQHSMPNISPPALAMSKDGRWMLPYRTYLPGINVWENTVRLLKRFGTQEDLEDEKYQDPATRATRSAQNTIAAACDRLVNRLMFDRDIWRCAQEEGLSWAPVRRPEENITDPHWQKRDTFIDVYHPELDRSFTYVSGKWLAPGIPWRRGPRAPLLGEHTVTVLDELRGPRKHNTVDPSRVAGSRPVMSKRGKPFALAGVRVVDLSWMLATGGAGRFFTSLGAEVIRVEHESRMDAMRFTPGGRAPVGGRAERDQTTDAISVPVATSPNRGGNFMEINAGKRSLSLNLKKPRARELLADLIKTADFVIEGFSPGTMDRMGFGYDRLRELNPGIIYVQQSGMGQAGTYGQMRSYGPTAQAFSGLTEMSGLPEPFPPAGIGYSYLDWFGAYNMAVAMIAALYRKRVTGLGCYIDSSQVETGIYLTGTAVLDYVANGRRWSRFGNRSPYKKAAPHGAYPTAGTDRWIAIACFSEEDWRGLASVFANPEWTRSDQFSSSERRIATQDALDEYVAAETRTWDARILMKALQDRGIAAGICQTAQDRYEDDPQLKHLDWLVELNQTEIGTWPVKEIPVSYSETPPYIGGTVDRSGPNYGEDNDYVLGKILGLDPAEIQQLVEDGIF
jgi:crotonobetainyl-CoA:carnitine CoA-transferase CaiB-like acyl-CoA transferase